MKFTSRTYRKALKKAGKREYEAFQAGMKLSGRDPWIDAMIFTKRLTERKIREKK